jgi:small subunit ribosomal protein S17
MTAETQSQPLHPAGRKVRVGIVVSNKMQKSIVVAIDRRVPHPLYKKYFHRTSTFMAHDEKNEARVGDKVQIMETRPLSRRKRWRLVQILERAK